MLTITQKCFFGSLDELGLFVEPGIKWSMSAGEFGGWSNARFPVEIGIKNQLFLEKPDVGILNSD